jgi:hypothetical protein
MNHFLASKFDNKDWLLDSDNAFLNNSNLSDFYLQAIQKSKTALKIQNIKIDNDALADSLSFGFWTGLFDKKPFSILSGYGIHLLDIFDDTYKPFLGRDDVKCLVDILRRFRNKVSHHNPVILDYHGRLSSYYCRLNLGKLTLLNSWLGNESLSHTNIDILESLLSKLDKDARKTKNQIFKMKYPPKRN